MGGRFQRRAALPGVALAAVAIMTSSSVLAGQTEDARPLVDDSSSWAVPPSGEITGRALDSGVTDAEALLDCGYDTEGWLVDCRVKEERPWGRGFMMAALRSARGARLARAVVENAPVGGRVSFRIVFSIQPAPPPAVAFGANPGQP
jgi:hypothetical protein